MYLRAVLLSNALCPSDAHLERAYRVGHVGALDEHALDERAVLRRGQLRDHTLALKRP